MTPATLRQCTTVSQFEAFLKPLGTPFPMHDVVDDKAYLMPFPTSPGLYPCILVGKVDGESINFHPDAEIKSDPRFSTFQVNGKSPLDLTAAELASHWPAASAAECAAYRAFHAKRYSEGEAFRALVKKKCPAVNAARGRRPSKAHGPAAFRTRPSQQGARRLPGRERAGPRIGD